MLAWRTHAGMARTHAGTAAAVAEKCALHAGEPVRCGAAPSAQRQGGGHQPQRQDNLQFTLLPAGRDGISVHDAIGSKRHEPARNGCNRSQKPAAHADDGVTGVLPRATVRHDVYHVYLRNPLPR